MKQFDLFSHTMLTLIIGLIPFGVVAFLYRKIQKGRRMNRPSLEAMCKGYNITAREQDVIRLIVQGQRNKEISENLGVSLSTVKKHITSIYQKLNIKSRDELITLFTGSPAVCRIEETAEGQGSKV